MPYPDWRNHHAVCRAAIPDTVRWRSAFEGERTYDHHLPCHGRATQLDAGWCEGGKDVKDSIRSDSQGMIRLTLACLVCGILWAYFLPQNTGAQPADAITYKPPRRGAPGGREGAGTRSLGGSTVAVLAPKDHTGLTAQEQPVLYWYLSQETRHPVEVILTDQQSVKPLLAIRDEWRQRHDIGPGFVPYHRDSRLYRGENGIITHHLIFPVTSYCKTPTN